MRTLSELHKAIESSKGREIHLKLRGLNHTKIILNRNFIALLQLNKLVSIELFYFENRSKKENFQLEFARLIHNYLAAVKSLVDHTRVLKKKLNLDSSFEKIYQEKRGDMLGADVVFFIQQLRVYVQHYELLPTGIQVQVNKKDEEKIILTLSRDTLKEFSDWNPKSLNVLNTSEKEIEIYKLIEEYQRLIEKFYEWFYSELEKIFKVELTEIDEIAREYAIHQRELARNFPSQSKNSQPQG